MKNLPRTLALLLASAALAVAVSVRLVWLPAVPDDNVAGYMLRWGQNGFGAYDHTALVSRATTSLAISNLIPGQPLHAAAQSVGNSGLLSSSITTSGGVFNLVAYLEQASAPEGPWSATPSNDWRAVVLPNAPAAFVRVRLEWIP